MVKKTNPKPTGPKPTGPGRTRKVSSRLNRSVAIAEPLRRATQPLIKKHGFSDPQIVHQWKAITGERLAAVSCPMRLSRQRGAGGGATLTVRIMGAAALEFEHDAPQIIDRINTFYGYKAVSRITLEQGPLPIRQAKKPIKPRLLSQNEIDIIEKGASRVKNPGLRRALEDLGKAIKSRENG